MDDFIYDQETGKCVARISNGEVFAEREGGKKIATVRAGNLYDLGGNLVGHLEADHVTGLRTSEMPISFKKLLNDE
jgi:hypothetical protein